MRHHCRSRTGRCSASASRSYVPLCITRAAFLLVLLLLMKTGDDVDDDDLSSSFHVLGAATAVAAAFHVQEQNDDGTDGTSRFSTGGRRVGEALDLPINEPPSQLLHYPTTTNTEDGAEQESSSSSVLLRLTEDNFVATFEDMFHNNTHASDNDIAAAAVATKSEVDDDVILCLFVVYSPECEYCRPILQTLEEVSNLIDEEYNNTIASKWESTYSNNSTLLPPRRPIVAKLDGSAMTEHFIDKMQPLAGFPTLKFALARRYNGTDINRSVNVDGAHVREQSQQQDECQDERKNDKRDCDEVGADDDYDVPSLSGVLIDIFDYIGPNSTDGGEAGGVVESIWHYWYRFVAAGHLTMLLQSKMQQQPRSSTQKLKTTDGEHPPVFAAESESSVVSFLHEHGKFILRQVKSHAPIHLNEDERRYVQSLLEPTSEEEEAGLGEPLTLFVQCRMQHESNKIYSKFDGLAEELVNRREVAFFAIQPGPDRSCGGLLGWFDTEDFESVYDGSIRVIKQAQNGKGIQQGDISALYFPPGKNAAARDNMTQFVIIHSTPTLLWFDRNVVADFAFPIYRTIHAVLFIDTPEFGSHIDTSSRQELLSNTITEQSRRAIDLFRRAAVSHRRRHPTRDVVFLVVPSYETRVFNIFGIDIWSGLDRQFASVRGINIGIDDEIEEQEQSCIARDVVVPTVMLASRTNPNGEGRVITKRYYLPASDILFGDGDDYRSGESDDDNNNAILRFIEDYLNGQLKPAVQSQPTPSNRTNAYGVQLVTGNTFEALVLDQESKHTLINFFAPTCGHCKRFNIVWNELGQLVRALHWEGKIDVMMMDLSKNELPLDDLHVWEYPSVFYFPAGNKTSRRHFPVPMKVQNDAMYGDADLRGHHLIEWLIKQRKIDEEVLLHLHEIGSRDAEGRGGGGIGTDGGGGSD